MSRSEDPKALQIPNLKLAQLRFLVSIKRDEDGSAERELLAEIEKNNMGPYYSLLCEQLGWKKDHELDERMRKANEETLQSLQATLADAESNQGENEVREACLARAQFHSEIGDKKNAKRAYKTTLNLKGVGSGQYMDILFALIRLGFFFDDGDMIRENIEIAREKIENGGDWDRRNRLKVYEAVYSMSLRQFPKAANLFLETLSTFTSYELFDYQTFIFYTVVTSIVSLPRPKLKEKVVDSPEILSMINRVPHLESLLNSFYKSEYQAFFIALEAICNQMKLNRLLASHASYFCREMRIRAYTQLLESYRSVQLELMAKQFGVSPTFLDQELSRFIASGRLYCKIDKVAGIVETTRPDSKNALYQSTIKQGDLLLNRIQKLSRVINI